MSRPQPTWMPGLQTGGKNPFAYKIRKVYNRSGSDSVANTIYQYDVGLTETAETSANSQGITLPAVTNHKWGVNDGCWMNVISPNGTGNANGGTVGYLRTAFWVLCLEVVANNELMTVMESGEGTVSYGSTGVLSALTSTTYTHATKRLTKTGGFSAYIWKSGDQVNINSGTNAITGLHTVTAKIDDDTIEIEDDGGTGNQSDFSITQVMRLDPWTRLEPVHNTGLLTWVYGNSTAARIAYPRELVRSLASTTGSVPVFFNGWKTGLN